jgi:hypothetical protein
MQPVLLTVNGTGTSAVVVMDYMQNPFNVGIGVNVSGGTSAVGWRIEHTFDNLNPASATVSNWFPNGAIGTGTAAATSVLQLDMNYAYAVRGIRLNVVTAVATTVVIANIVPASNAP